jgi:hypothetical protein
MPHRFHFFRAGGVDQVSLRDGSDMLALAELDPKLWMALSMPTRGVGIDSETLTLLDADGDGRLRVPDILAALVWAKVTFVEPGTLLASKDRVELTALADPKVVSAAKRILSDLGTPGASAISVADTMAISKAFAETLLNGDGIVIAASARDDVPLRKVIEDAIACVGSITDRSGKPGIDQALADALFREVDARASWLGGRAAASTPLAAGTAAAHDAFAAVRDKLDDFFTRCRVVAYDGRVAQSLIGTEPTLAALGGRLLHDGDDTLASLPLAQVSAAARLPLRGAINPAWSARLAAFVDSTVTPILGARDQLGADDVEAIRTRLAPYTAWIAARPVTKVDALDEAWIAELAAPALRTQLATLIAADAALAADYEQISAVSKAVHAQRDFGRILRNFVNFSDFYSMQDGAFQAGTLYIDARALHLCVAVADAAKHGVLASASDTCLLYCDLTRKGSTRQIVAALTNGDIDNVFVGRNGVFYDRDGLDWDAVVTKVIANPISIRAAFWSPYKWLVKTIEDTVAKRAQAAEARSTSVMQTAGTDIGYADRDALADAERPPVHVQPAQPAPSKVGKIDLGTIAAIGVAIGGIGTLVGALLGSLFGLGRWLPIGIVAVVMMISGPSMLLAWLKLRRRNLGPILDANGWAINSRARINVAFGAAMTELARLPTGAKRSLDDPFADKRTPWRRYVAAVAILGLAGSWYLGKLDDYLPDSITSVGALGDLAPAAKARAAASAARAAAPATTTEPTPPKK